MSIIKKYRELDASTRFLIAFPVWLLILFGLFYWGRFWSHSPIGEYLDSLIRSIIMPILDALLDSPIIGYDIIINPHYKVVITPECNGLIPFLMISAAIIAFSCSIKRKVIWVLASAAIFFVVNIFRLYIVAIVVKRYGSEYFYYIHDIGGNLILVVTGALIFLRYIRGCDIE